MIDEATRNAMKRMWIGQLVAWTRTGLVGSTKYTLKEMHNLITTDEKAKEVVPEYKRILKLVEKAKDRKEIETGLKCI